MNFKDLTNEFERYQFIHQALPEINRDEIDVSTRLFGKKLNSPLLISSMIGGTSFSSKINKNLAQVAQSLNISMGIGSQRIGRENPNLSYLFKVRDVSPDILLFANLGAVQLNYGYGLKECQQAIEMIEADALFLHLNPLQEALQKGGNVNFKGLVSKIEKLVRELNVPVIIKEVGCGISYDVAKKLQEIGVAGIDISGSGGTCWALIEQLRVCPKKLRDGEYLFTKWGIPTAISLRMVQEVINTKNRKNTKLTIIASGGIKTGIDIAKAIAMGADIVGIGLPLLHSATKSPADITIIIKQWIEELKTVMFCIGAKNIKELQATPHLVLCRQ